MDCRNCPAGSVKGRHSTDEGCARGLPCSELQCQQGPLSDSSSVTLWDECQLMAVHMQLKTWYVSVYNFKPFDWALDVFIQIILVSSSCHSIQITLSFLGCDTKVGRSSR